MFDPGRFHYLYGFSIVDAVALVQIGGAQNSLGVLGRLPADLDVDEEHRPPDQDEHGGENEAEVDGRDELDVALLLVVPRVPVDRDRRDRQRQYPDEGDEEDRGPPGHVAVVLEGVDDGGVPVGGDEEQVQYRAGAGEGDEDEAHQTGGPVVAEGLHQVEAHVVRDGHPDQEVAHRQAGDELVGHHRRQLPARRGGEEGEDVAGDGRTNYHTIHRYPPRPAHVVGVGGGVLGRVLLHH